MSQPLATVAFVIEGDRDGKHIKDRVVLFLMESDSFHYGNGTCVAVEYESGYDFVIDTRYEPGLKPSTFPDWAFREMRRRTAPEFSLRFI